MPKEQWKVYESRYGSWEVPLYNFFEQLGVSWAAVDVDGRSLLHIVAAIESQDSGMVIVDRFKFLMSKGLDVTAEDKKQRTPLDIAATFGNTDILDLFKKEVPRGEP